MQISVESTGNLGRRMTVAVPAARFEQEFASRLKRLSQNVKLPGFRPGKVPLKMVEAQYGGQLLAEVAGDLVQTTFYEAANKEGLRPAGGPKIEPKSLARGKDFEYVAVFEIYPEIGAIQLPQKPIERIVCAVEDADIDRTLDTMRKQRTQWNPVARPAQSGDKIEIDFKGMVGGVAFEGGEAKAYPLVLGSNALIEGFEQQLLGAAAGEHRSVNVTFPADYRNTQLAGQPATFEVDVRQVFESVLPEVNESFLRELGMNDGTVESLRAEIRKSLQQEADDRARAMVKRRAFQALMDANSIEIPDGLIESEAQRLLRMTKANLEAQRVPTDKLSDDPSPYRGQARERVLLGLILAEFVKSRGIKVGAADIRARIEQMAKQYQSPNEFIQWHYANPERIGEIESLLLEERALDIVLQESKTEDRSVDFQTLAQMH